MEDTRITNMQHSVPELNYECTSFFLFCFVWVLKYLWGWADSTSCLVFVMSTLCTPTPYSVSLMPHLALAPISVSNENCERPGSETNGWPINDIIMTMRMVNIG